MGHTVKNNSIFSGCRFYAAIFIPIPNKLKDALIQLRDKEEQFKKRSNVNKNVSTGFGYVSGAQHYLKVGYREVTRKDSWVNIKLAENEEKKKRIKIMKHSSGLLQAVTKIRAMLKNKQTS